MKSLFASEAKEMRIFHPPNRILLPIAPARAIQQEFPSSASNPFGNSATDRRGIFPHDALLTSSPCDNNVPEGLDLLCIFDARNGFVENLRASVEPGAQLLIIASDPDAFAGNDEMAATFEGCFAAAEIELEDVCVLDSRNAGDAAELVAQSGVILLSGGHVPTETPFRVDWLA